MSEFAVSKLIELVEAFLRYALWPVTAMFLGLLFRSEIRKLIGKLKSAGAKGFQVQFGEDQQTSTDAIVEGEPLSVLPAVIDKGLVPDQARLENVRNYGGQNPVVLAKIQGLERDLHSLGFEIPNSEPLSIVIRHLAVTQLDLAAEKFNRLAYDSQIQLLVALNAAGSKPVSFARSFYETACLVNPEFYADYSFERWIDFPIKMGVLGVTDAGEYGVTAFGRDLIDFITKQATAFSGSRSF